MEIRIRPVDDGYTKLIVDGEQIYYDDNDNEVIDCLLGLLAKSGHNVIEEEHEWTYEVTDA